MNHILYFTFVILVSFLLAKVEINIEGKEGYAQNLPVTWRTTNKWVQNLIGGTSYHLYMWALMFAMLHIPFFVGMSWNWKVEALIIAFLLFITVLEDFLWFVLNPAYGIKKYKRTEIPWFEERWFLFTPVWYWYWLPAGIIFYYYGC